MAKITIKFPDGSKREYESGTTPMQVAESIGPRLAKEAVAGFLNEEMVDMNRPIEKNSSLRLITTKDGESVEVLRHSTAHVLAEAVVALFPEAKPTIGPVVEEGFYYDFDHPPFKPEDLEKIEKKMQEIISKELGFERLELKKKQALELFKDNKFKVEMIEELEEGTISAYKQGDFIDLCRGPHIPRTDMIGAFKLTKLAGAYWRGDASNKQLQRIYGVSFFTNKELNQYNTLMEEASKRDHRKIGKELDLYSFHEQAPGMAFWHAKGMIIWNELLDFWRQEHRKAGYVETKTPLILNKELWLQSGHWDHYKENMYFTKIDQVDYAVKPMNCPGGMLIYKEHLHSYREFPMRVAEVGLVHRHELSGVLSGLFRVRSFHQDDAHIFMTQDQMKDEIIGVFNLVDKFYKVFNLPYHVELSTRPEKAMGEKKTWDLAEKTLEEAMKAKKINYQINPGDGAFYGPKLDFHIKDAIGRTWQMATIQLDFLMPEKFDLTYEGPDGKKHRPVMIHRVIYGAIERFIGVIVEHYAGKFPLWLSPVQATILPIADRHKKYCEQVKQKLFDAGIRVEIDYRAESTSKKVRDAQLQQINYILVVGDNEEKASTVNVRTRDNKVHGEKQVDDFLKDLKKEIEQKL